MAQNLGHLEGRLVRVSLRPALDDGEGGVETDVVRELDRAHGVAAAELHGRVDVLGRGVAAFEHAHRFGHVRDEQPVHDEARGVLAGHRGLAAGGAEGLGVLEDLRVGDVRAHDLDELHQLHGVEEVQADEARRAARGDRHLADRERAGVRGEDRRRLAQRAELLEERLLGVEVLDDGLDHEVAVGEVLLGSRAADAGARRRRLGLGLFLGRLAVLDGLLGELREALVDAAETAVQELLLGLEHDHRAAALGRDLHDAVAHQAAAHHAHFLNRHEVLCPFRVSRRPSRARARR